MRNRIRLSLVVLMVLAVADHSQAARAHKKQRMKLSFSEAQAAAPAPQVVKYESSRDDVIRIHSPVEKHAAAKRHSYIANPNQEDEISGGAEPNETETVVTKPTHREPVISHAQLSSRTSTRVSAKTIGRSGLTFVPVLGMSSSSVAFDGNGNGSSVSETGRGFAFTGGAILEMGRGSFSYETGLLYLQETFTSKVVSSSADTLTETAFKNGSLNFLGIPLLARMNFSGASDTRYHIKAGVIPVYLVSSYWDYDSVVNDQFGSWEYTGSSSDSSSLNSFNVYAALAAGADLEIAGGKDLRVETSYRRTILPISKSSGGTTADSILLTLGMGFDI
jgi:hypothetical protein